MISGGEDDGCEESQKLVKPVGEEEAMRPNKTDTGQIDVVRWQLYPARLLGDM